MTAQEYVIRFQGTKITMAPLSKPLSGDTLKNVTELYVLIKSNLKNISNLLIIAESKSDTKVKKIIDSMDTKLSAMGFDLVNLSDLSTGKPIMVEYTNGKLLGFDFTGMAKVGWAASSKMGKDESMRSAFEKGLKENVGKKLIGVTVEKTGATFYFE
jgi:hypothetical protein